MYWVAVISRLNIRYALENNLILYYYFKIILFDSSEHSNLIIIHWKHLVPRHCVFADLEYFIMWQDNVANEAKVKDLHYLKD